MWVRKFSICLLSALTMSGFVGLKQSNAQFLSSINSLLGGKGQINLDGSLASSIGYWKQDIEQKDIRYGKYLVEFNLFGDAKYNIFDDFVTGVHIDVRTRKEYWEYNRNLLKETFIYLQNKIARIELGYVKDIVGKMQFSAPDVGYLGINNSAIYFFINVPSYKEYPQQIFINGSTDIGFLRGKERINFITSGNYKLQFAASYGFADKKQLPFDNKQTSVNDQYSIGLSFASGLGSNSNNAKIALSAGFSQYGETYVDNFSIAKRRQEISAGINLGVKGFIIGGSVLKINETPFDNLIGNPAFDYSYAGWAYNGGVAFEIGKWASSLSYHGSIAEGSLTNPKDDMTHMLLFSLKRYIFFKSYFYFSAGGVVMNPENPDVQQKNKGFVILTGFVYSF